MRLGWVWVSAVLGLLVGVAQGQQPGLLLSEDFATDGWQQRFKQAAGGPGNRVQRATVSGRPAAVLRDLDAQGSTTLDAALELPRSGRVSGFVRLPSVWEGAPNAANAYFAVQLFGGPGGPRLFLSGARNTAACGVQQALSGQRATPLQLPGVLLDDAWIPWQIAWEWDGRSPQGRCRVAVLDKETDPLPYDASALKILRLVAGWSTGNNCTVLLTGLRVTADPAALRAELPSEQRLLAPFALNSQTTVLSDTFDQPDPADASVPRGWYHWKPDNDPGQFVYDQQVGRRDQRSVCLAGTRNGVWQRKLPARPGARYRFSAWLRAERAEPTGTVSVALQPKVTAANTGQEAWADRRGSTVPIVPQPGFWQHLEAFLTVPADGAYPEGKLTLVDVELLGKSLQGKVWFDDVRLEEVAITAPWTADFTAPAASAAWQVYGFHGLEGQAALATADAGFADPGSLQVNHVRGQVGFSAAQILPRAALGELHPWTLVAHASGSDGGVPALGVQQLDAAGALLLSAASDPAAAARPGWREHRVTFTLLPRTTAVRLLLTNNGPGSARFDNAWLRPAQADEVANTAPAHPLMVKVFPADVIAAIDRTPPLVTVASGQVGAFNLHLYGDATNTAPTRLELEVPAWLELRTAQQACYGEQPATWTSTPAARAGRMVYTFRDPYPWQKGLQGAQPNPYTGLLTVWRPTAAAGTTDEVTVRTFLGDRAGEVRTLKLAVRPAVPTVPALKDFAVGIWTLTWLTLRDPAAHRELLHSYVDAGVQRGAIHETHGFGAAVMQEVGFRPALAMMADLVDPATYRGLPEAQRPPLALTAAGAPTSHYIALGLALSDPAVHTAYKARLAQRLRAWPPNAVDAFADIEFWGDGSVSRTDFHPATVAEFRRRAKLPADQVLTPQTILKEHFAAWSDFRNALTAELHGVQRRILQELRPTMRLWAYDYPLGPGGRAAEFVTESPMNALRYEPYVDGHLVSYYNVEGARFLDAVDNDTQHLQKPVWAVPFLMKNINLLEDRNFNYAQISARELRFELVAAAASGAAGHLGFSGQLLDADYLQAYAEGVAAVAAYEALYRQGTRQDAQVRLLDPAPPVRHRVHIHAGRTLLTLFNGGTQATAVAWERAGQRTTTQVPALDFVQILLP